MKNKQEWGFTVSSANQVDVCRIVREAVKSDPDVKVIRVTHKGVGFVITPYSNAVSHGLDFDGGCGAIVPDTCGIVDPVEGFGVQNSLVRDPYIAEMRDLFGLPPEHLPADALVVDGQTWVVACGKEFEKLVPKVAVRVELF